MDWTQLQWSFETVEICSDFPLGVKTMYRAYSCDEVNEIVLDSSKHFGYSCQKVNVQWFPAANQSTPSGMYLLQRFPTGEIKPCQFVKNSIAILDHVLKWYKIIIPLQVVEMYQKLLLFNATVTQLSLIGLILLKIWRLNRISLMIIVNKFRCMFHFDELFSQHDKQNNFTAHKFQRK